MYVLSQGKAYCKSTKFGRYKIWWICYVLSDNRGFPYIILFNFCPNAKSAKLNSMPNFVDLQYTMQLQSASINLYLSLCSNQKMSGWLRMNLNVVQI